MIISVNGDSRPIFQPEGPDKPPVPEAVHPDIPDELRPSRADSPVNFQIRIYQPQILHFHQKQI